MLLEREKMGSGEDVKDSFFLFDLVLLIEIEFDFF